MENLELEALYRTCVWHAEAVNRIPGLTDDPSLCSVIRRNYSLLATAASTGWRTVHPKHQWVEGCIRDRLHDLQDNHEAELMSLVKAAAEDPGARARRRRRVNSVLANMGV